MRCFKNCDGTTPYVHPRYTHFLFSQVESSMEKLFLRRILRSIKENVKLSEGDGVRGWVGGWGEGGGRSTCG